MLITEEQKVEFGYINHTGGHCLIQKKTSHNFFCKTQFSAVFEAYIEHSDSKDVQLPQPDGEKSGKSTIQTSTSPPSNITAHTQGLGSSVLSVCSNTVSHCAE